MVVYIQKRLHISVCIPSGAGTEGGGVGCMVIRQPSLTCRTSPPPYVQFLATPLFLASCLARPRKVIGTHTDRSDTYDYLLTLLIATMYQSRAVSKIKRDIGRKLRIFLNRRLSAEGFLLEYSKYVRLLCLSLSHLPYRVSATYSVPKFLGPHIPFTPFDLEPPNFGEKILKGRLSRQLTGLLSRYGGSVAYFAQ